MPSEEHLADDQSPDLEEAFLMAVMNIQREYGTDKWGQKTNRRNDIKKVMDKLAAIGENDEN